MMVEHMTFGALSVCVVDDDESVREALPDVLREFGLVPTAFETAEAFLASGLADQTKCLILDIAMPGMSGPELKQELEKRGYVIPIIFISARSDFFSRPEVRKGAVACLTKPFSDTDLSEALKKALN
jgi:FixJ family two-component response regulator